MKYLHALAFLLGLLLPLPTLAVNADDGLVVLTGTQVTYSIANALLRDTPVEVVNVPEDGRRFDSLKDYIERRQAEFEPLFQSADAVIAYTNVLAADPLYRFAREANIELVYIDAAQPWSFTSAGVALIEKPLSNMPWAEADADSHAPADSPYFWLSPTNAARMVDIVGSDLERTFPDFADAIRANRSSLHDHFLSLFREYQQRLINSPDITLFALADEFVYLTNDLGLFVDGYFIKQDIEWTESDLAALTERLIANDVRVVVHKWEPSEAIRAAIDAAGAQLVVLDTADPGQMVDDTLDPEGYQAILRDNLEALVGALEN